jgi:2-keto-4-pentenoate hydratase
MAADLAKALWDARVNGDVITVEEADQPANAAAAYVIQADSVALSGLEQVGWKLGATNAKILEMLGLDEPILGPLFAPHCHTSGARLALPMAHRPALETEFLIGLTADLPAREGTYERDEAAAAIGYVAPAFELVGFRFAGEIQGRGLLAIADGGANTAIIQGEPIRDWRRFDLGQQLAQLKINDAGVASGTGGVLLWGDPLGALVWLASHPLLADCGLKTGEIVMTGTCTGITPLMPGDEAVADFGELGEVRATFT